MQRLAIKLRNPLKVWPNVAMQQAHFRFAPTVEMTQRDELVQSVASNKNKCELT